MDEERLPEDERAARRTVALFALAVLVVAAGVVVLLVDDRDDERPTVDARVATIGPETGTPVPDHIAARRTALNATEGRRIAVVSLTGYVTVEEVDEIVGPALERRASLVAFPGAEGRLTSDVDEARQIARTEAEGQIAEIESILPTVDDPEFAAFYRGELNRYRRIVDGTDRPDVVYGAVVVGRAGDLRALASRTAVRLVDVGPPVDELDDDAELHGLRPEETVTAGEPRFRP